MVSPWGVCLVSAGFCRRRCADGPTEGTKRLELTRRQFNWYHSPGTPEGRQLTQQPFIVNLLTFVMWRRFKASTASSNDYEVIFLHLNGILGYWDIPWGVGGLLRQPREVSAQCPTPLIRSIWKSLGSPPLPIGGHQTFRLFLQQSSHPPHTTGLINA